MQPHLHAVPGELGIDPVDMTQSSDFGADPALVSTDNLGAAVGEDRPRHALATAPCELSANRDVTDRRAVTPPENRTRQRGAVTDVERDAREGFPLSRDRDHVGNVEHSHPCRRDAVPDGRRA